MPHIIAEPCVGVVEMACVDVCPTDAIIGPADVDEMREIRENGGPDALKEKFGADVQMYIDPEECIDCAACAMECPNEAIFDEDELPEKWVSYVDKALQFFADR